MKAIIIAVLLLTSGCATLAEKNSKVGAMGQANSAWTMAEALDEILDCPLDLTRRSGDKLSGGSCGEKETQ